MKPLRTMNNVEKAKLLFELFPDEMPQFISVMEEITQTVLKDPEALRDKWEGQILTVEFWVELANTAIQIKQKYRTRISKDSKLFADKLFNGYQALFSAH